MGDGCIVGGGRVLRAVLKHVSDWHCVVFFKQKQKKTKTKTKTCHSETCFFKYAESQIPSNGRVLSTCYVHGTI